MSFFEAAYRDILHQMGKKGRKPSASIKPSSLFCPRKMTFEMLQVEPRFRTSPEGLLRMEDGKAIHHMIQKHFDKWLPVVRPGWVFQYEIKLTGENCPRAAALFLRCSLDGFGSGPESSPRVLEIKSTGESQMATLKSPKPEHVEQLNTYLYLVDARDGELLYFNRSNLFDMRSFECPFDSKLWKATEEKIHRVLDATVRGQLPPTDVNTFWCRDCSYGYCCRNKEKWVDAPRQEA